MTTLLHLNAGARRRSFSREAGDAVAAAWRAAHPGGVHVHRDLARTPVPQIGEAWTELCDHVLEHGITDPARYAEAVRTPAQAAAWAVVEPLPSELLAADAALADRRGAHEASRAAALDAARRTGASL
ncbi:NAD(P)H-dependent oxidoreductase [Streptomyces sp. NPDC089915]|uniref:NAD(P)H-dependent oxidoreductase n=1 Tax=Streptomyces sp. NPDC089915 TaxID=3155186 RepID=UPI00342FC4A0